MAPIKYTFRGARRVPASGSSVNAQIKHFNRAKWEMKY